MARENRDRRAAGGAEGDARRDTRRDIAPEAAKAPGAPGAAGGTGGPVPTGNGGVPSAPVPAQRTGDPTVPPVGGPPPPPPLPAPRTPAPPAPPPAMPLSKAPQSAVPPGDPGATGRSGGSRRNAPAATPAAPRGRDTTDRPGDGSAARTGHGADADGGPAGQLLGEGERDRLGQRLHHALAGFVDSPQGSVAEAAEVLAAAERELIAALRDRSTALRAGWQENGGADGPGPDTEQLRLTLRTYREVTERLLRA
ncbi:hypothetical protein [Streptomyces sp. NPDC056463]|uniref:hypothetical protein n=1 Tax=Streptomyces sp. NPDC056463 TaxID=3345827 RepID=UPI0036B3EA33